ncbi:hypothetical protein KIPB_012496, partial [Kipferlia bialata]
AQTCIDTVSKQVAGGATGPRGSGSPRKGGDASFDQITAVQGDLVALQSRFEANAERLGQLEAKVGHVSESLESYSAMQSKEESVYATTNQIKQVKELISDLSARCDTEDFRHRTLSDSVHETQEQLSQAEAGLASVSAVFGTYARQLARDKQDPTVSSLDPGLPIPIPSVTVGQEYTLPTEGVRCLVRAIAKAQTSQQSTDARVASLEESLSVVSRDSRATLSDLS